MKNPALPLLLLLRSERAHCTRPRVVMEPHRVTTSITPTNLLQGSPRARQRLSLPSVASERAPRPIALPPPQLSSALSGGPAEGGGRGEGATASASSELSPPQRALEGQRSGGATRRAGRPKGRRRTQFPELQWAERRLGGGGGVEILKSPGHHHPSPGIFFSLSRAVPACVGFKLLPQCSRDNICPVVDACLPPLLRCVIRRS